jgi:hypothetical protein
MSNRRTVLRSASILAPLLLGLAGAPAFAVSDLSGDLYQVDLSTESLNEIQSLLPESQVNTAFVNPGIDPNLRLLEDAEVMITFIGEGAGYRNSFGYFLFDDEETILGTQTIFSNASAAGSGGSLTAGDTVNLGVFDAGTNIGFWLQGNGYSDPDGHVYYTLDQYNPDGERHVAVMADIINEQIVLGVEDLFNLGDADYNDIIFTMTATPFSAIDISSMPTGAPEAGQVATALICASLLGLYTRRRRQVAA